MDRTSVLSGGCACGAVSYAASAEPSLMLNCHCRDCQRATGAGYAPIVVVPRDVVETRGELRYHALVGGSGKRIERGFCPACGSPVAFRLESVLGIVGLLA